MPTPPALPRSLPRSIQELPPKRAHFVLGVERFLRGELGIDPGAGPDGKRFLVAVSGGADSTALLLVCTLLARRHGGSVAAAHLDHALRPESARDAAFVRELCAALAVPLHERRTDVAGLARERGVGLEEAGRDARNEWFAELIEHEAADYLCTGHHLDDLAEDVLLRLLRGAGWPALAGMAAFDPRRRLLRPFLLTPKAELAALLADLGIPWCEDASNADPAFTRNRVRSRILPLLLEENPAFPEAVARLWRQGRLDEDYWRLTLDGFEASRPVPVDEADAKPPVGLKTPDAISLRFAESTDTGTVRSGYVADFLQEILKCCDPHASDERIFVPAGRLAAAPAALRLRLYKRCLERLGPGQSLADNIHKLDEAWTGGRFGAVLQFPGGKAAMVSDSGILFEIRK